MLLWGREPCSDESLSTYASLDSALMYAGFAATSATLFSAGVVTTATFTVMMSVSKSAAVALPDAALGNLAGTHYTVLATAEILGKLVRDLALFRMLLERSEFFSPLSTD